MPTTELSPKNNFDEYEEYRRRLEEAERARLLRQDAIERGAYTPEPNPVNPLAIENPKAAAYAARNKPSELGYAMDEYEDTQAEESNFGFNLDTLTYLTSPLMAIGDAVLAPVGDPANTGSVGGDLAANLQTSWKAFTRGMLPEFGQKRPEYGARAAMQLGIDPKWGLALEVVTDPTIVMGIGAAKLFQHGLLKTAQAGTGKTVQSIATGAKKGSVPIEKNLGFTGERGPWENAALEFLGAIKPMAAASGPVRAAMNLKESEVQDVANRIMGKMQKGERTVKEVGPPKAIVEGEGVAYLRQEHGFTVSNPSEKWMKGKQAAATAYTRDPTKTTGSDTAWFRGDDGMKSIELPRSALDNIEGAHGEHAFRDTGDAGVSRYDKTGQKNLAYYNKLEAPRDSLKGASLKESVAKEGVKEPIRITVNHEGVPYVSEGNHRLAAAKKADIDKIPVELVYKNGGEEAQGILSPDRVAFILKNEEALLNPKKEYVFLNEAGTARSEAEMIILTRAADKGNRAAVQEVAQILNSDSNSAKIARQFEEEDITSLYNSRMEVFGDPDGAEIIMAKEGISDDLLKESLNTDVNTLGGQINLARSITDSAGGNNIIRRMEEIFREQYQRITKTVPNAATYEKAQNVQLGELMAVPVQQFTPEDAFVIRQSLVASADNLFQMARKASSELSQEIDQLNFDRALAFHYALQDKATGAASHAGRLLQSYNMIAKSNKGRLRELQQLLETSLC